VLLFLMGAAVVALARTRNLLAVIILGGIYSFLMATVLVALDAVDVAMTEASVGAAAKRRGRCAGRGAPSRSR
jgi:multicomponent Na+:H+ antiporter subunit B